MLKKLSLISIACLACASTTAIAAPKNIIYMIGDGMGPAYLAAYRYYMDNPDTKAVESTVFDELWVGNASTYPDDDTVVTDSAAAATALSSTHKTYNGAIAVDHDHKSLTTMMEIAKAKGMQTGVVVTAQINHATPAGFLAHDPSRNNYNQIADDYIDNKVDGRIVADLMLGGGTSYFIREDRNLVEEFKQAGYQYTDNWTELKSLNKLPALGLFAPKGFVSALDNPEPLPLKQMTEKALELLSPAEKGFVVMIEGSQIDWCGHANDIACAMAEMHDFAEAIKVAKAYVDAHPDTLLVITADHETGGLSLGANGNYSWKRDVVKKVKHTGEYIAGQLLALKDDKVFYQAWLGLTGLELNSDEQQLLSKARAEGQKTLAVAVKQRIDRHSSTGWTSSGHTAADVPVLAYGADKLKFAGFQDNTEIAAKLIEFIQQKK
ncbi:Alkaline phosphatase [Rheinheimera sp. A13L]|uniref:alkaline phosphatase n=1 Tax=Rheinheimera sp. A13L TaxID=506534 RepID=UPI0002124DF6|nr:alkaline phosphatase [Rheinheimera sp. A13L]EGM76055.1 Alkaline phosphatase [Rheinheimera sp. A13L]